jgi:hypothetical protein
MPIVEEIIISLNIAHSFLGSGKHKKEADPFMSQPLIPIILF